MATNREPWIKLKIGFARSDKIAQLPDDSAKLGWVHALLAAKTQRRMGVFVSRAHLVDLLGRRGEYYDAYVAAGLLHVAPVLCEDCARLHVDDQLESGNVVVHDYLAEQRDPTNADRQAQWRARQAAERAARADAERDADVTAEVTPPTVTNGIGEAAAAIDPPATVTPQPVTSPSSEHKAGPANGGVTPDSRARRTTATTTTTGTPRKKDVIEEELDLAASAPVRPTPVVDDLDLSDPNRAGRPKASTERPLAPPPGIASATPKWRTPCTSYVAHQREHRLIDGMAVCPPCEDAAAAKGNGAARDESVGLWGGSVQ